MQKPNHKDPSGLLSSTSRLFQACSPMPPSVNTPEHCVEMKVHKSSGPPREDDSLSLFNGTKTHCIKIMEAEQGVNGRA